MTIKTIMDYFYPMGATLSKRSPKREHKRNPFDYFRFKCPVSTLHITTISIGCRWLGKKRSEDQYTIFCKKIRQHIPYRSESKYIYCFELQKNGQLHAHGIEYDTYQGRFMESFCSFGSHNTNNKSFQECRNLEGYIKYINKENIYPTIHNILKKDLIGLS